VCYGPAAPGVGFSFNDYDPSGQTKPSTQDRLITKKISEGGKILDINLMDHIIYTEKEYYSFADEGEI
jgi:DNA repair protein RadC